MPLQQAEIQPIITNLVEDILNQGEEFDLDAPITADTLLIGDLDFASIDFVQLCVGIEEKLDQKLGFHDLLMQNGQYVDDLTISQFVNFVETRLNSPPSESQTTVSQPFSFSATEKLVASIFTQARAAIPAPIPRQETQQSKNPPALFLLCPSRSGSTLLRVILAGHPQLFAPPELHLLTYNTLQQRRAALANDMNSHLLNGTIRAIMQARGCSAAAAEQIMQDCEEQNMGVSDFYGQLQSWIGDRLLVEKTPSYAYHFNIIKRAEEYFSEPFYIHLLRHPCGMIRSFEDAQMERLIPFMHQAMQESHLTPRQIAEIAWVVCHQNILDLLARVPANRQIRIKYEDLVTQPNPTVERICQFLGLEVNSNMLDPYSDKQSRMTDGVETVSKMSGDLKFHLHKHIEPEMAYRWKQYYTPDFLSDVTKQMATDFGYTML